MSVPITLSCSEFRLRRCTEQNWVQELLEVSFNYTKTVILV